MKVTGIVSEYNPFHYGHQYHIHKTRELTQCDVLINVMSGHFVQRGEASLAYKWDRARKGIEESMRRRVRMVLPMVRFVLYNWQVLIISCLAVKAMIWMH